MIPKFVEIRKGETGVCLDKVIGKIASDLNNVLPWGYNNERIRELLFHGFDTQLPSHEILEPCIPKNLAYEQKAKIENYHASILEYFAVYLEDTDNEIDNYQVPQDHYNDGAVMFQEFIEMLVEQTQLSRYQVNRSLLNIFYLGEDGDWLKNILDHDLYDTLWGRDQDDMMKLYKEEGYSLLQALLAKEAQRFELSEFYSYSGLNNAIGYYDPNTNSIYYHSIKVGHRKRCSAIQCNYGRYNAYGSMDGCNLCRIAACFYSQRYGYL